MEQHSWTRATLTSFAAVTMIQAVRAGTGNYTPLAFLAFVVSCAALAMAAFGPPIDAVERWGEKGVLWTLGTGLAAQWLMMMVWAFRYFSGTSAAHVLFFAGLAGCGALMFAGATGRTRSGAWFPATVLAHFLIAVAWLQFAGVPNIDVIVVQKEASAALTDGRNPYAMTYPNPYGERDTLTFYGKDYPIQNGRVQAGFAYPPLVLYLCLPSYWLTGDVRYAHLLALAISALLLGLSGDGLRSRLAALLLLFSPVALYLVQSAWTEPFILVFFSLALFYARRGVVPLVAIGLMLAAKQYVVFALPVGIWLLLPHPNRQRLWRAALVSGLVAAVVSLPLILWDVPAFIHSAITILFKSPFRSESLSWAAWLARAGFGELPTWFAFAAVAVAGVGLARRLRPSPASFALSLAVSYLLFFTLSRQAVLNYHVTVAACMLGAVASMNVRERQALRVLEEMESLPVAG